MERRGGDLDGCDELVRAILDGERAGWTRLVERLCPAILGFTRTARSLGPRRFDEDTRNEVLTAVLERLRKNDFRALKTYRGWQESNSAKTFEDWLRIVTDRVACDHVGRKAKRTLMDTLAGALESGIAPRMNAGMTDAQTVRELVEHAEAELPEDQARAIRAVVEGKSTEDIARETDETQEVVEKRLRAAYARLRRWVDETKE